jgi:hypothetical protein
MKVIKRLPTAEKPIGSAYDAPFRKVSVSDTNGKAVAIVDVDKDQIVKTLEFKCETGMPQYDPSPEGLCQPAEHERGCRKSIQQRFNSRAVPGRRLRAQPWYGNGLGPPSCLSPVRRQPNAHGICFRWP